MKITRNENIVKSNVDCFEKSNNSNKHIEYITVTRNGKTFTQRYRKNTPEVIEPKTVIDTKTRAATLDKIFHSNYYDGEFYDNSGNKIKLPEDWKEYAKKFKTRSVADAVTDAHINSIHLMDSEGISEEEKVVLKKQIYKNEREKFLKDALPKIKEKQQKAEDWVKKNETRLKNIHKESYTKEGIIKATNRSLGAINEQTTFNELSGLLKRTKVVLGEEINDKKITYNFNGKKYEDEYDNFLTKINSKIESGTFKKNNRIDLTDFKIEKLEDLPEDKMPAIKSWEEYRKQQLDNAPINK